eukprot:CAMPEP_0181215832 /NCGR_PEP_ID=MMETSP1096-20121128/26236_1 /TAXON_ID=156174 ORGANISM="Chrysochromulina ericina, Strain CCMP281" /NCGR_SAMPLE_ID=MMETSP1096 /ASSEMBLY_ACC=CAM_ASM_000453 /LENGTH=119 /DNA_ID=CAMNT_0023307739 /DNA_START=369 /DNA_END=725 /DNA_ORIENTATION=+
MALAYAITSQVATSAALVNPSELPEHSLNTLASIASLATPVKPPELAQRWRRGLAAGEGCARACAHAATVDRVRFIADLKGAHGFFHHSEAYVEDQEVVGIVAQVADQRVRMQHSALPL